MVAELRRRADGRPAAGGAGCAEFVPTVWLHRHLRAGIVAGVWVTSDFWRFDTSTRTLSLPNGWVATYDAPGQYSEWAWLHDVHDVYGNAITPTWDTSHRVSSVA